MDKYEQLSRFVEKRIFQKDVDPPPRYASDVNEALLVVEHLRSCNGFFFKLENTTGGLWKAAFAPMDKPQARIEAFASEPAFSICLAALKAACCSVEEFEEFPARVGKVVAEEGA